MPKKENRGGARKGSGRPKKEVTTTLSYRVPLKKSRYLDSEIKALINKVVGVR